jgi:hypothetical protein
MKVDITLVVCVPHEGWAAVIPNREEYLSDPPSVHSKNPVHQGEQHLGHDHHVLSGDVMFLKRLPEDTLGFSIGVHVGRVKGIDTVVVPVRDGDAFKETQNQANRSRGLTQI